MSKITKFTRGPVMDFTMDDGGGLILHRIEYPDGRVVGEMPPATGPRCTVEDLNLGHDIGPAIIVEPRP